MKKRLRTALMNLALSLYSFSERFVYADVNAPIGWIDHVRWWIEGRADTVFSFAYRNSAEEIRDGVEFALDNVNPEYLTPNQLEIRARLCEFVEMEDAQ
jgi:hypothetical protein